MGIRHKVVECAREAFQYVGLLLVSVASASVVVLLLLIVFSVAEKVM